MDEHRQHRPPQPPTPLEFERQLQRIEAQVVSNTRSIERLNTRLGEGFTTLIFELDHRYTPREELRAVYMPREELEQRRRRDVQFRLQIPIIVFAGFSLLTNILLIVLNHV